MKEEGFDPTDYSFVVKRRGSPPKPWRWEIYCAGSMAPVERSPALYESMAEAGSNDIFQTARTLTDRGFSFLQISPNYYGDLRARFGLDDAMICSLRALNILYDRDGDGEYFQLYSPVIGEGFFLEVVQRTGGYSGYGAPNAAFRIASQRRLLKLDVPA